ncbi:acyl carrier protein phosphodiesterase [Vibrio salinus]|uniref:acyl carrier protein phosphodiesterase n=1 Tax=Vibrio salinus TaxID=2899784 RepID=UPI001E47D830|nr:ACP phosphodiesterase [Vibrio salinus]MCE0496044.1 ACP phosphodiesterase [Vibrio salinus]
MNYLAHLHIASFCQSSPLGNLLGDFVRGDPAKQFDSGQLVQGIYLHRWVDRFTDESSVITEAKSWFPKECRRFSPVALDIFWDHMLGKLWDSYSSVNLNDFCDDMRAQCCREEQIVGNVPSEYSRVSGMMWEEKWLQSYQHWEKTKYAIERLSTKKSRYAPLALCNRVLETRYSTFEALFKPFYLQLLDESISYVRSNFR